MIEEDDVRQKAPHWFNRGQPPLKPRGGGGTSDGMEERVTRLETHFEYVRKDLDEIKADQKKIISALSALPTKRDLTTNILVMVAIGLSVMAITVGGIIGGLAFLDRPARPSVDEPWRNDPIVQPAPPAA